MDLALLVPAFPAFTALCRSNFRVEHCQRPLSHRIELLVIKLLGAVFKYQGSSLTAVAQQSLIDLISAADDLAAGSPRFCHGLCSAFDMVQKHESKSQLAVVDACVGLEPSMASLLSRIRSQANYDQNSGLQPELAELRPAKRRKGIHSDAITDLPLRTASQMLSELCSLLGNWTANDLGRLPGDAENLFSDLSQVQQTRVLDLLGDLSCAKSGTIVDNPEQVAREQTCPFCGSRAIQESTWTAQQWEALHGIFSSLSGGATMQSSRSLRICFATALRRFAWHTPVRGHLQLDETKSSLSRWCLQSLRSSFRELRQVAAHTLPTFCRSPYEFPDEVCLINRRRALGFLKEMTDAQEPRLAETAITALSKLAPSCGDTEVNLILLQLVDFLGHQNPLICSLANLSLREVAESAKVDMAQMFAPYWNSIAIQVVKDLPAKPQKLQQLADLLGVPVNLFLLNTQHFTVPYLVLWKRSNALVRIAQARGEDASVWSVCMNKKNMNPIIALIIVERPENADAAIIECLGHAHRDFLSQDPIDLVKSDPITLACEILKIAADREDAQRTKALQGFQELASMIERRGHSTRTSTTQARMTTLFFENHALGVLQSFSDAIDNPNDPLLSKQRCLRAMERMMEVGGNEVSIALPQIRSCLDSALKVSPLRDAAFSAWLTMVNVLTTNEELEGIVENTFVIIAQHWHRVSSESQTKAHDSVAKLVKEHQELIQAVLLILPSLGSIPMLSKFENQFKRLKSNANPAVLLSAFIRRLRNENAAVVKQALSELLTYLGLQKNWVHDTTITDNPDPSIPSLLRCLLDIVAEHGRSSEDVAILAVRCLGIIGAVDPNRVEAVQDKPELIVLSNFEQADDAVDFVVYVLEHVLVKAFLSVTNPRTQGFLAYTMQEMLRFCGFNKQSLLAYRPHGSQSDTLIQRWQAFSESARDTLTPFLSSKYVLNARANPVPSDMHYPRFTLEASYSTWVKDFTFNLVTRAKGPNAAEIFSTLGRVVRGYDASIAAFLLPFVAANVIIGGERSDSADIITEIMHILSTSSRNTCESPDNTLINQASDSVFQILDYLSKWLHEKRKQVSAAKIMATRTGRPRSEIEAAADETKMRNVEFVLASIPAKDISKRAIDVHSYARALVHWEAHIRQQKGQVAAISSQGGADEAMMSHLHEIYASIDDPDGLEGISTQMTFEDPTQKVKDYQKVGNWTAAESWFEYLLKEQSEDLSSRQTQEGLVACLGKAGKAYAVIDHVNLLPADDWNSLRIRSAACEAAWKTGKWAFLDDCLAKKIDDPVADFNSGLAHVLNCVRKGQLTRAQQTLLSLRLKIAQGMTPSSTSSVKAVRTELLHLQALEEVELVTGIDSQADHDSMAIQSLLNKRLDVLGSYNDDKEYLLGIRRAAMTVCNLPYTDQDFASVWMKSARLARKSGASEVSYRAAIEAKGYGDTSALIEQARYMWKSGEHRKAIRSLESIISSGTLQTDTTMTEAPGIVMTENTSILDGNPQAFNLPQAKAHLLLAKWLDQSGLIRSNDLNQLYQKAANCFRKWEKGYYYLGRFYNKLLEAEKNLPISKQTYRLHAGETAKLVMENYLRSLIFGCKYLSETMPKILTLWLDTGNEVNRSLSKELPDDVRERTMAQRPKMLDQMNRQVKKYGEKVASWLFYTALNQMITRIGHSNTKVYEVLAGLITKTVASHSQQGLWALLAVSKSSKPDRANRGIAILGELKKRSKNVRHQSSDLELKNLISQGQRLADSLLDCCNRPLDARASTISLRKDLKFNATVAPCALVVPWEQILLPNLPALGENVSFARHKAFPMSREAITIQEFLDDVLVLSSLQRPRKLTVRGSNGRRYGLLCKPKDDLRKDQRLMEFNTMINRSLKKDAESSKRRLYIKTYAVTPLNEECGVLEWVEGLKPLRDILLNLYRSKGVKVDYGLLRDLLNQACDANNEDGPLLFTNNILAQYPPALHEWFIEHFPSPDVWFAARTRYTRSCAVMSMSGHVLGLGDRHGENVLLEEGSGGVFHVDFNCLFDKGLTFEKPELVPFRLTHNMVDAFGAHGVEGPFRRSAECTMSVMRAAEGALLTIMETFVYDPTADFVGPRRRHVLGVPETPKEVLESVRAKVGGLMRGDTMPLSVDGHVDKLIAEARDPKNLAAMYIGWCAFL